jgi:plastocyanin
LTTNEKPHQSRKKIWMILGAVIIVVVAVSSFIYLMNMAGSAPSPPAGPNVTIWDTGFCSNSGNCGYSPASKNATLGTAITWTNTGGQPHTVTECTTSDGAAACSNGAGTNNSASRAFDSNTQYSSGFRKDQQFTFTFNTSTGTFYYYCTLHLWMHGTIVVT